MRTAALLARLLLGLIFITFGLNGFLLFLVPPLEEAGQRFIELLYTSRYLHVVKAIEILGGLLLLPRRTVPLGLTLLGPVVVNILLFHALLAPSGMPPALLPAVLWSFLIWRYRRNFRSLLAPPAES